MKKYNSPMAVLIEIDVCDVLTASAENEVNYGNDDVVKDIFCIK